MILGILVVATLSGAVTEDIDVSLPERVDVLPVFFVPRGEAFPTREQKLKLMKHIKWAQDWYREALGGHDTFRIAKTTPDVYRAKNPFAFYRQRPPGEGVTYASHFVGELLDHYDSNRFNCPYVFAVVFMSSKEDFPIGGGRPFNGGLNRGGGMLNMSSFNLDRVPNFQSTLRHELGHAFGLVHVDAYKYDMSTTPSMMAYNLNYHTKGFEESVNLARFIAEDIRGLAINKRCFARLKFDPNGDNTKGKKLYRVVWLGPMEIVGQPSYDINVTTGSGSTYGSKPINIVQRRIDPSAGPGNTWNAASMWSSDVSPTGWVSVEVTLPVPVMLTRIGIHTQHSAQYHAAERVRIEVKDGEQYRDVVEQDLDNVDAVVSMPPTRGKIWRIHLRADRTKMVVVRGLRFFNESGEIFPPAVPYRRPSEGESANGFIRGGNTEVVVLQGHRRKTWLRNVSVERRSTLTRLEKTSGTVCHDILYFSA